jgi:superfamily II DNA/RNA helicase
MEGRDLLACAPTGSGKTGAFVIPLFARLEGPKKRGIRGLIVSPTRELATQIYRQCDILKGHCKMQVRASPQRSDRVSEAMPASMWWRR